jgi:SAM-dependent methyltransferase
LMRHCRMRGSFLEIGADIGLFADACACSGQFDRLFLYEPNLSVHAELMQRLRGRDLTVRHSAFSATDLPARSVSAAAMIHVLDHVLEPLAVVRDIREALQPGGVLLIVVHNSRSLLARALGRRWPPLTLQHPHLFSPKSLAQLFASAGLECIDVRRTINHFPATHFVHAALAILGFDPGAFPAWDRPLIGLPLGNVAAVARRPG